MLCDDVVPKYQTYRYCDESYRYLLFRKSSKSQHVLYSTTVFVKFRSHYDIKKISVVQTGRSIRQFFFSEQRPVFKTLRR